LYEKWNEKETYQVVQLDCGDTLVHARNDFLGDSSGVNVIRVQAITQPGDTGCDLVELHAFFASIYMSVSIEYM
jgi:hypothetical protein